jgi:putative hydrolase
VEPWVAEEFQELARLAEYHLEQVAPFPVRPATEIHPVDSRAWAEASLELYGYLVEPFATSMGAEGPAAQLLEQMAPAIIGLQVGSLVGSIATWMMAPFDAGLPPERTGPIGIIVPNISAFEIDGIDRREIHLWVAANEVAFGAMCQIPWVRDHVADLVDDYATAAKIDPSRLSGLIVGGGDPEALEQAIADAGGIESLIGGEEAEAPKAELEAFLGALTGAARLLARRAVEEINPAFDRISDARDELRSGDVAAPPVGVGPVPPEATRSGDAFNQEVERRYGEDALETLWSDPTRMPSATELRDPTSWAARVLLDGWT